MTVLSVKPGFYFTQPDNAVSFDRELTYTAKMVYLAINKYMNVKTRKCKLYVKTIAEEIGRSIRTVQRALKQLIERGVILRNECFDGRGQTASCFEVVGREASCYEEGMTALTGGDDKIDTPINKNISNDINNSLTRESESEIPGYFDLPLIFENGEAIIANEESRNESSNEVLQPHLQPQKENINPEVITNPKEICEIDDAPEIMQSTAEYLLLKTGRKKLTWSEISALRELAANQYPSRVQKEIDTAYKRFLRKGRDLCTLTFDYIAGSLKYQKSRSPLGRKAKLKAKAANIPDISGLTRSLSDSELEELEKRCAQ